MSIKSKRRLMITGIVICAALFFFSGAMLIREFLEQKQSADAFSQVAELVNEDDKSGFEGSDPEKKAAFEKYSKVYAENNDFVGWITIPGTRIDYPVMQTKDNPEFYIDHDFDKSYSKFGVPFMQENCNIAISDNLVIYGHHMYNGTMFSDLCKYSDEEFYRAHKTVSFDTLDGFGKYEIIAVFKTVAYSADGFKYYNFVRAEKKEAFDSYIAKCKKLSLYDTGVTAEYGDKLITLSTCEYSRNNGRMVVVAKLIDK